MLVKDLTKVWVSEYEEINDHGEINKKWKFKGITLTIQDVTKMKVSELTNMPLYKLSKDATKGGIAYLNLQQDVNELDRKSTGEVDYSIVNARTDINYNIEKGNGISLTDISQKEEFEPDYIVTDNPKIGRTTLYKLEKVQK